MNEAAKLIAASRRREQRMTLDLGRLAKHLRYDVQRCTCPGTPGVVRRHHEVWCPWAILDRVRHILEGE